MKENIHVNISTAMFYLKINTAKVVHARHRRGIEKYNTRSEVLNLPQFVHVVGLAHRVRDALLNLTSNISTASTITRRNNIPFSARNAP